MGSRGMMTMLLSVIFCLLASTSAQDDCPANPNSPSCADPVEETICQLSCDRDSGEVCAQSDEAKCGQIGVDVANETFPDMYPTRCKEICEASRGAGSPGFICRFYKVSNYGNEVVCSLMNDEQCTATGPCGSHCVSGDVGCKDTPIPGPHECPAAFEYTDSAFHFGCDHCNPYSDATCEEGNKCFTTERCSEWDAAGLDPLPSSAQGSEPGIVWQAAMAQLMTTLTSSMTMQPRPSQTANPFQLRSCQEFLRRRERTSFATTSWR